MLTKLPTSDMLLIRLLVCVKCKHTTLYRRTFNAYYAVCKKYMDSRLSPLLKETFSWREPRDRAQENKVCGDRTQPKACRKKSHEVKRMRHH